MEATLQLRQTSSQIIKQQVKLCDIFSDRSNLSSLAMVIHFALDIMNNALAQNIQFTSNTSHRIDNQIVTSNQIDTSHQHYNSVKLQVTSSNSSSSCVKSSPIPAIYLLLRWLLIYFEHHEHCSSVRNRVHLKHFISKR